MSVKIMRVSGERMSTKANKGRITRRRGGLGALAAAAVGAVAALFAGPLVGSASGQTWTGASGGEWGVAANWASPSAVPNSIGATAILGTALTINLSDTGAGGTYPYTVGQFTFSATGSAVLGNNTVTTDVLNLQVASGSPTIAVTNGGGQLFVYANLTGTQGFTKLGGGKATFRFNGVDQAYTGTVNIGAGVLGIERDRSLGDTANGVTIANGARLLAEPGSNSGTITLPSSRTITLSGAQAQIGASGASVNLLIEGPVVESVANSGLVKTDGGRVTLAGALSYTGETRLAGGTLALTGSALLPATQNLRFNQPAAVVLDVGNTNQTVRTIVNDSQAASRTVTGTGSLTVNGDADVNLALSNGFTFDLSRLGAFTFNRTNRNLIVGTVNTASQVNISNVNLSGGVNTVTANAFTLGGGLSQGNDGNAARVNLGTTNVFNVNTFQLGAFNSAGTVAFQGGLTSPSLKIRGIDGVSRATDVIVGFTSSGARSGAGYLNLTGGSLDALVTTVTVGRQIANATLATPSVLLMDAGTLDATTIVIGDKLGGSTPTLNSTLVQNGGVVRAATLIMGQASDGTASFQSSYNLNGGSLAVGVGRVGNGVGTGGYAGSSQRRINFAAGTITTLDANTDMTVNGTTGAGGSIALNLTGAGEKIFDVPVGRTISFGTSTTWVGDGAFSKSGAGTLVLGGSGNYTGSSITVSEGTLQFGNSATYSLVAPISGAGAVTKSGTGVLTLAGPNTFAGQLTVAGGVLAVPNNEALGGTTGTEAVNFTGGVLRTLAGYGTFARDMVAVSGTSGLDVGAFTGTYSGALSGAGNFQLYAVGGQLTVPSLSTDAFTGEFTLRTGNFELSNSYVLAKKFVVGSNLGSVAVANLSGSLVAGSTTTSTIFSVGDQATSGTLNVTGSMSLSNTNAESGVATLLIGHAGPNQTASGTVNVTGIGTLSYVGGIVEVGGSRVFTSGAATGTLNVAGNALVDFGPGGRVFVGNRGEGSTVAATGTINLDGGTLRTARTITNGVNGGVGTINFNGGLLQAGADGVDLVSNVANGLIADGGLRLDDNGYADVTMSQSLTNAPGSTGGIVKSAGAGTVTLTGSVSIAGSVGVASGKLRVTNPLTLATGVNVAAGSAFEVAVPAYGLLPSRVGYQADYISVAATGRFNVLSVDRTTTTNHGVVRVSNVDLADAGGGSYGGFLDLGNNDMIVDGGVSQLATLRSMVAAFLATGNTGLGTSATGFGDTLYSTLAVVPNVDPTSGGVYFESYDGVSLDATDVIVKYTYVGDTNLDGILSGHDLTNLIEGLSTGATGWQNGDLNYDGVVNGADYGLFATAFAWYGLQVSPPNWGNGSEAGGGSSGAIPEPSSLGLIVAAASLATRRRRRA